MKFTALATLFAALLVSGHAATAPEAASPGGDNTPAAAANVPAPEAAVDTGDEKKRELRGSNVEDHGTPDATTEDKEGGRKMKETSGQSCGLCCNDDYYC